MPLGEVGWRIMSKKAHEVVMEMKKYGGNYESKGIIFSWVDDFSRSLRKSWWNHFCWACCLVVWHFV
jgi:hypothetical protein